MSRKASSCLHGPRPGPISSSRRSSSSIDNQESGDGSLGPHNHSTDMTWPTSTTSSPTSKSSFLFLSDGYGEPTDSSTSNVDLKCKSRHLQQPGGRRPLPPIPQDTHRPSLSISISSSQNSTGQRRPRWLPVPPLPMAPFPTIGPTACSSPETSLPPPMDYSPFDEEIDWCMVDEILATFSH
ncbi:hypothetical protein PILCRDRAFT_6752 [Piloderma croceum F 1598]|uniref:Uncharacterized protein n=1 Tax=Piloderma croceum (strain F 1598) TaxID=765440 RepID=A0A0C3FWC5_PILCF|nr:hypothetical protein PILCRDRAFT_6752 [Piloderma croceum F 1598]